jgi:hypothetical protein
VKGVENADCAVTHANPPTTASPVIRPGEEVVYLFDDQEASTTARPKTHRARWPPRLLLFREACAKATATRRRLSAPRAGNETRAKRVFIAPVPRAGRRRCPAWLSPGRPYDAGWLTGYGYRLEAWPLPARRQPAGVWTGHQKPSKRPTHMRRSSYTSGKAIKIVQNTKRLFRPFQNPCSVSSSLTEGTDQILVAASWYQIPPATSCPSRRTAGEVYAVCERVFGSSSTTMARRCAISATEGCISYACT